MATTCESSLPDLNLGISWGVNLLAQEAENGGVLTLRFLPVYHH